MDEFSRDVYCLLGLPVDAVSMAEAALRVRQAAATRSRCFISTPNVNFLIATRYDESFRRSVIASDLVLVDGMPLVWLARLLGLPISERVAGSDLFDALLHFPLRDADADSEGPNSIVRSPLRVFFFGGLEGIAARACENLNFFNGALRCVGTYFPGFGSLDEMSSPVVIDRINASAADFLVVALGAMKGQAWIVRNLSSLTVPVVGHLGAVINFVGGNVRRAPTQLRRLGLEWAWRILEEPALWRRYWRDGIGLVGLLGTRVVPCLAWRMLARGRGAPPTVRLDIGGVTHSLADTPALSDSSRSDLAGPRVPTRIWLSGALVATSLKPIREAFREAAKVGGNVNIDLHGVTAVDSAFLGLLLVLAKHVRQTGGRLVIDNPSRRIRRLFWWNGVEYLFK